MLQDALTQEETQEPHQATVEAEEAIPMIPMILTTATKLQQLLHQQ